MLNNKVIPDFKDRKSLALVGIVTNKFLAAIFPLYRRKVERGKWASAYLCYIHHKNA